MSANSMNSLQRAKKLAEEFPDRQPGDGKGSQTVEPLDENNIEPGHGHNRPPNPVRLRGHSEPVVSNRTSCQQKRQSQASARDLLDGISPKENLDNLWIVGFEKAASRNRPTFPWEACPTAPANAKFPPTKGFQPELKGFQARTRQP
jgi:hypothetical protein